MKYVFVSLLLFLCSLYALSIDGWHNIRFSEKTSAASIYLRTDSNQSNINLNKLVYNAGSGNIETDLATYSPGSYQAQVYAGTGRTFYGLRRQAGNEPVKVVPLRYAGTALPASNLLTKVSDDPANDQSVNHQDIIAEYISLSDTKLIVGLQNRGGGFPTSGGWFGPFYSYMVGIGDPSLEDPNDPDATAWALQFVNASGIMNHGLYKITGTSIDEVNRIADIDYSINSSTNTLVMSCDISVLLNDPDFTSWYDPANPSFGILSLVNKISVSFSGVSVTQQDNSNGGIIYPVPLYVDPQTVPVGQIGEVTLQIEDQDLYFETQYTKPEDRFCWDLTYQTDDGRIYPMFTSDPEHAAVLSFRSANLQEDFPEVDNEQGRIWVERTPDEYHQSNWYSYSFVRAVNEPQNLQMEVQAEQLTISWDPVTQTPAGTTIEADYYVVEYASDPASAFTALPPVATNSMAIPLSTLGEKTFLKVRAHKIIP